MLTPDNLAEEQLQQELREMFLLDTAQQLQSYFDIIQQLNPTSWVADIQTIYRAIHTIKGGAVTVEANSMLYAAIILEQLLSDLRYLEVAPPLDDGNLIQTLLEAGELLASCLEATESGNRGIEQSQLTLGRLEILHLQVKGRYLPDWNEMKQVHQEFAEQGFDLVVLELEMAVNQLPEQGIVPTACVQVAVSMLTQLREIGVDLEFDRGWAILLDNYQGTIDRLDCQEWRSSLPAFIATLKRCAKSGGVEQDDSSTPLTDQSSTPLTDQSSTPLTDQSSTPLTDQSSTPLTDQQLEEAGDISGATLEVDDWTDPLEMRVDIAAFTMSDYGEDAILQGRGYANDRWDFGDDGGSEPMLEINDNLLDRLLSDDDWDPGDDSAPIGLTNEHLLNELFASEDLDISDTLDIGSLDIALEEILAESDPSEDSSTSGEIGDFLDDFIGDFDLETYNSEDRIDLSPPKEVIIPAPLPELSPPPQTEILAVDTAQTRRNIQIPVPLARLDRSAQQVVDTLLTTRTVNSQSQTLQLQLAQLTGLTAESADFAAKLRQIQDDYSLLRSLSDRQESTNNPTLERYRQGYTTINRLIENILRMSELGQELEISTRQTFDKLADLDRQILRLKDGIEVSRLVPFRNLTMRARAILRDLTNRYGKPVELVVNNEQIELDAGVVQQLEPAFLHLLRNAYDHGIESVQERLAAGKLASSKVTISIGRRGNIYRLTIADDGRGIDRTKIATIAQRRGFTRTDTSTNADLLMVLCQPGFSSTDVVSEVSGRGVGMDVVDTQIAAIGGKLRLDTQISVGTTFTIEVPAPQLLVSCVLLKVGDRTVALPTADILETVLLSTTQCQLVPEKSRWEITTPRGVDPGFSLASYWQQFSSTLAENAIGLRCRLDDNSDVWSIADDLIGQSDLLISPLPSPLIPPPGLLGVSLQPDGRLISVLDPIALNDILQTQSTLDTPTLSPTIDQTTTTILVVDDAALMRRRLSASLTSAGYVVHTCGDGLEALKWLQSNESPSMMITDVEMPNMDGLTLIDRCRQTGIEIPILVLSSRLAENWGDEAKRVGANDYLNKGFTTERLLSTVSNLLSPILVRG